MFRSDIRMKKGWSSMSKLIAKGIKNMYHFIGYYTRLGTWPIPVADGWAGAEMRVFPLFDSCLQTDGLTKPLIELRVHNTLGFMRRNVSVRQGALLW